MSLGSKRKLQPRHAALFALAPPPLFAEIAEVVCATGMLPRKELHECWQMASRVHEEFPACRRVADLAAGHGLLAWILVLLAHRAEPAVPRTAVAVDVRRPKSARLLAEAMTARWPELADTVHYVEGNLDTVTSAAGSATLLVALHACGSLSDRVLLASVRDGNPVAIMPCCHSPRKQRQSLAALAVAAGFPAPEGIGPEGIDRFRREALTALGYETAEAVIQPEITPFNRILMGRRLSGAGARDEVESPRGAGIAVDDAAATRALAQRPSRVWRRSFDLSYWVGDDATGDRLAAVLATLAETATVSVQDRYTEPGTGRRAFTYRVELASTTAEITKAEAMALRQRLLAAGEPKVSGLVLAR